MTAINFALQLNLWALFLFHRQAIVLFVHPHSKPWENSCCCSSQLLFFIQQISWIRPSASPFVSWWLETRAKSGGGTNSIRIVYKQKEREGVFLQSPRDGLPSARHYHQWTTKEIRNIPLGIFLSSFIVENTPNFPSTVLSSIVSPASHSLGLCNGRHHHGHHLSSLIFSSTINQCPSCGAIFNFQRTWELVLLLLNSAWLWLLHTPRVVLSNSTRPVSHRLTLNHCVCWIITCLGELGSAIKIALLRHYPPSSSFLRRAGDCYCGQTRVGAPFGWMVTGEESTKQHKKITLPSFPVHYFRINCPRWLPTTNGEYVQTLLTTDEKYPWSNWGR